MTTDQLAKVDEKENDVFLPANLKAEESALLGKVFKTGNIADLNPQQQWDYTKAFCERLGLDPFTQPFMLLKTGGKTSLYAKKETAEQLGAVHGVTVDLLEEKESRDVLIYKGRAYKTLGGRHVDFIAAISIKGLVGEDYANALMKLDSKLYRRGVLRFLGLGALDRESSEGESESVPMPQNAKRVKQPTEQQKQTVKEIEEADLTLNFDESERDQETGEVLTGEVEIVEDDNLADADLDPAPDSKPAPEPEKQKAPPKATKDKVPAAPPTEKKTLVDRPAW